MVLIKVGKGRQAIHEFSELLVLAVQLEFLDFKRSTLERPLSSHSVVRALKMSSRAISQDDALLAVALMGNGFSLGYLFGTSKSY